MRIGYTLIILILFLQSDLYAQDSVKLAIKTGLARIDSLVDEIDSIHTLTMSDFHGESKYSGIYHGVIYKMEASHEINKVKLVFDMTGEEDYLYVSKNAIIVSRNKNERFYFINGGFYRDDYNPVTDASSLGRCKDYEEILKILMLIFPD